MRKQTQWRSRGAIVLIASLTIALLGWGLPRSALFEMNPDEGIELTKAILWRDGVPLYGGGMVNDQPPLFTAAIATLMGGVGEANVAALRWLPIMSSGVLLAALGGIVAADLGWMPAIGAVLILFNSEQFLRNSLTIAVGIPCLALGMVALSGLVRDRGRGQVRWLVVSGVAMGLALQTKLIVGLLAVPVGVLWWGGRRSPLSVRAFFRAGTIWLITVLVTMGCVILAFPSYNLDALLSPHLAAIELRNSAAMGLDLDRNGFGDLLLNAFNRDYAYYSLALIGTIWALRRTDRRVAYPLAWLAIDLIWLRNHYPIWDHYILFVAIPIAWLAAYGLAAGRAGWRSPRWGWRRGMAVLVTGLVIVAIAGETVQAIKHRPWNADAFVAACCDPDVAREYHTIEPWLQFYAPQTRWFLTDRPIYGVYAGLPVPPEIAVFSKKMLATGGINDASLTAVLRRDRPEQVAIGRFRQQLATYAQFTAILAENYIEDYSGSTLSYYHRRDLPPMPARTSGSEGRWESIVNLEGGGDRPDLFPIGRGERSLGPGSPPASDRGLDQGGGDRLDLGRGELERLTVGRSLPLGEGQGGDRLGAKHHL